MSKKKKITTVADLPKGTMMGTVKVKTPGPEGITGWWVSQWDKGVWIRKEKGETRIHPVFVENLKECMDWEVVEVE